MQLCLTHFLLDKLMYLYSIIINPVQSIFNFYRDNLTICKEEQYTEKMFFFSVFFAVQDSSISDIVGRSVGRSV